MQDAQCGVGLAELFVDLERLPRRRLGSETGLRRRNHFLVCRGNVGYRQPRISKGVVRIQVDRSLEVFDAFLNTFFRPLIPKEMTFYIKLVGFEVVCVALSRR